MMAGLTAVAQKVHRGPAPFLLTEGIAAEPVSTIHAPHFIGLEALRNREAAY